MKTYDSKKNIWGSEEPTDEVVGNGSAIAAAYTSDGKTSVFYQPAQKIIAMYSVDDKERDILGIPTTLGSSHVLEVERLTIENKRLDSDNTRLQKEIEKLQKERQELSDKREAEMLGLVPRRVIDEMSEQTRVKFVQHLGKSLDQIISSSWAGIINTFDTLSNEFGLGIPWEGDGKQWKGMSTSEYSAMYSDMTLPQQSRLVAFSNICASRVIALPDAQHDFNGYLHMDTLYQLCRYVGVN
jgi:hypothetical protein